MDGRQHGVDVGRSRGQRNRIRDPSDGAQTARPAVSCWLEAPRDPELCLIVWEVEIARHDADDGVCAERDVAAERARCASREGEHAAQHVSIAGEAALPGVAPEQDDAVLARYFLVRREPPTEQWLRTEHRK